MTYAHHQGGSDDEEEGGRSGRRRGGGGADNKASGKTKAGKVTIGAAKKPVCRPIYEEHYRYVCAHQFLSESSHVLCMAQSVYKEPPKPKPRAASSSAAAGPRAPVDREAAKKRRAEEFQVQLQAGDEVAIAKRVRQSTKQKTQHAEAERQQRQQIQLVIGSKRPPKSDSKPTFNQRDMLTEALETEQVNTKWLRIQQMVEDEMAKSDKHALLDGSKKLVRHLARRGTYPTITFVNSETLPEVLQVSSQTRPSVPVQTGAKYRDPVTGRPYNTAEEFRALRSESGVPFVYR